MTEPAEATSSLVPKAPRNPGPSWGYQFLRACDRVLPEAIFRPLRALGTWIALTFMPAQRRHSRAYLALVLGRAPTLRDVFRHFFAFEESLMLRLRVANGRPVPCEINPSGQPFYDWLRAGTPALLGSMHVGVSDQLGFQLGDKGNCPIYLVRQRVGNSHDTEKLGALYGNRLRFIWINDPSEMLFALKDAAARPGAIALGCDRYEHSARAEAFEFLGARRLFPFTIYHLALIFQRPVYLSVGLPLGRDRTQLHGVPAFEPRSGESKAAALARAREHFQTFLQLVESLLREQPYQWFNFRELNPPAEEARG